MATLRWQQDEYADARPFETCLNFQQQAMDRADSAAVLPAVSFPTLPQPPIHSLPFLPHAQAANHPSALSFLASEFVAFAVHRLWHRQRQKADAAPRRRQTVPPRPAAAADVAAAAVRALYYPLGQSTESCSDPHEPQTAPSDEQASTDENQQKSVPANEPFSLVICPPGTEGWYPSFFQAVHKLLDRSSLSLPYALIALLYIARLRQSVPQELSGFGSEHNVFLAAIILAQKFHSDERYSNAAWAKIADVPLAAINDLEREFLIAINGRLHVSPSDYAKWSEIIHALGQEHSLALVAASMRASQLAGDPQQAAQNQTDMKTLRRIQTVPRQIHA